MSGSAVPALNIDPSYSSSTFFSVYQFRDRQLAHQCPPCLRHVGSIHGKLFPNCYVLTPQIHERKLRHKARFSIGSSRHYRHLSTITAAAGLITRTSQPHTCASSKCSNHSQFETSKRWLLIYMQYKYMQSEPVPPRSRHTAQNLTTLRARSRA